jgi:uncharacterized protein
MFEFDQAKSISNKVKHGIDFDEAQVLWLDEDLIEFTAKQLDGEMRSAAIGILNEKHWTAFYTWRGEAVRLISVRRSRNNEVRYYEDQRT